MPVCPTCHSEPPYQVVLRDRYIRKNIECVNPYLLGQPNQARRIRDVDGVLQKCIDMGVSLWAYLALLVRVLLLAVNCTAILYAFITYRSDRISEWKFEIPTRIVVWAEFLGIGLLMLWMIWRFLLVLYTALKEYNSRTDNLYKHNLEMCTAVREWYEALMRLDFNLLLALRFISPPAVVAALAKARRRVYGKYGTRVHREECCSDLLCCCCFYGRLVVCTLLWGSLVVVLAAAALLAVFLKVLQLRFLGTVDIRDWSIPELLLFGQFVVNMAWMDSRQHDRRRAKLELLYQGADAEESSEERVATKLVEDLALLVMRYHYSLITALAVHHSITSEDISYLYIEDRTEADKPRTRVKHEYHNQQPPPPPPKQPKQQPRPKSSSGATASTAAIDPPMPHVGRSSEWVRHTAGNGTYADIGATGGAGLYSGQVVVEMSRADRPQHHGHAHGSFAAGAGSGTSSSSGGDGGGPSAPPLAAPPLGRFPFEFYTHGRAVGAPVLQGVPPELKERYEQNLYCTPKGR